jgi:hypothetical protein
MPVGFWVPFLPTQKWNKLFAYFSKVESPVLPEHQKTAQCGRFFFELRTIDVLRGLLS